MAEHLPPNDLLNAYVTGDASPGVALLVATHLATTHECRGRAAAMEGVAGALFADGPATGLAPDSLDIVLERIEGAAQEARANDEADHETGPFPRVLSEAIGCPAGEIPWRFRLPGVSDFTLDGFGPESVGLLRARPGRGVPQHTHEGRELTLVLSGALEDGGTIYRRGDVAVNDEHDDHHPRIVGDEICHCLTVVEGGLRFTGRFGRVLNYLGE